MRTFPLIIFCLMLSACGDGFKVESHSESSASSTPTPAPTPAPLPPPGSKPDPEKPIPPPTVKILSGPTDSPALSATVQFEGKNAEKYECSLNGRKPVPCSSPHTLLRLSPGKYHFAVTAIQASKKSAPATVTWTTTPKSHLQYFGFFVFDQEHVGNTNLTFGDPNGEMRRALAWPFVWEPQLPEKATLTDVQRWLWHSIDPATYDPNHPEKFLETVGPKIHDIVVVYLPDEADCGGIFPYDWTLENCTRASLHLEEISALIKTAAPSLLTWINYTSAYVNWFMHPDALGRRVPRNVDWISFDCYTRFESCFGPNTSVKALTEAMSAYLSPTQRVMYIPQGFYGPGVFGADHEASLFSESDLVSIADDYYNYALTNPRVIGMFPFHWAPLYGSGGVATSPLLKAKFQQIGKGITGY